MPIRKSMQEAIQQKQDGTQTGPGIITPSHTKHKKKIHVGDLRTQVVTWCKTIVERILGNTPAKIDVPKKIEVIEDERRDPVPPKSNMSMGAASLMIAVPDGRRSVALPVSVSNQKERILAGITNAMEKTRLKISDIQVTIEEHLWIQEIYSILTKELFEEIRKVEGAESKIIIGEKGIKISGWMDLTVAEKGLSFIQKTLRSYWKLELVKRITEITQTLEHFGVAHSIEFPNQNKLIVTLQAHYGKDCTLEYRESITKGFSEILERSIFPKILEGERIKSRLFTDIITQLPNQVAFSVRYNVLKQIRTPFQVTKISMIIPPDFAIYGKRGEEMGLLLMSDLIKNIDSQQNTMLPDTAYHIGDGVVLLVSTKANEGEVPFILEEIRKYNLSLKNQYSNLQIATEPLSPEKTCRYIKK